MAKDVKPYLFYSYLFSYKFNFLHRLFSITLTLVAFPNVNIINKPFFTCFVCKPNHTNLLFPVTNYKRSEERRVGKEYRSRGGGDHQQAQDRKLHALYEVV